MRIKGLAMMVALAACGGGDDDGGSAGDASPGGPDACAAPGGDPAIIYLNREGGTYSPGPDDSFANTTGVTEEEHVAPPHPFDDDNWDAIVACYTAGMSAFAVDIVEADPGDVDHTEVVFTENGDWLEGGIGSISGLSCAGYPRGIAFVFSDGLDADDVDVECHLALSQVGSLAAGLDHVVPCEDWMSQADCETPRGWTDDDLACGDFDVARACTCGGDTQNSFQKMTATFGPACL